MLGVMGCPNWHEDLSEASSADECNDIISGSGAIMIAHIGCGTWTKRFSLALTPQFSGAWTRCFVDGSDLVQKARFCIPDSQTWESLPLSTMFDTTIDADSIGDNQILLLPTCCGRSELVYNV